MESIQEAFIMLDIFEQLPNMKQFQQYALIFHCINLKEGFKCTGFIEDDPKEESKEGIVKLPNDWTQQNMDVVSFRYEHPTRGQKNEEFYFKFLEAAHMIEINALSSINNNDIVSSEFDIQQTIDSCSFNNLDPWVQSHFYAKYEKEVLSKLLKGKKQEGAQQKQDYPLRQDPFPLRVGQPGIYNPYAGRVPHIIGDPYIPGQSPLMIPPSFRPPGTSGPGGNLVGPGSQIFHPRGGQDPYDIDPASFGGIPRLGGDDPNDLFPSIPGLPNQPNPFDPRRQGPGGFNPNGGLGGFGPGGFGPMGGGGSGFGGGGFYS